MELHSHAVDGERAQQLGRPAAGTEYTWCRAVPGGTGITVLALLLSRPISIPSFQSALRTLQASHPIIRSHLTSATNASGNSHPFFSIDASPFISVASVSSADLPSIIPSQPPVSLFHSILEHELNQDPWSESSSDSIPVFFATVYELPEPERTVLALRFHTSVCDRTSAVEVLKKLLILMDGRRPEKEEVNKEEEVLLGIEDLIPKQDAWKPFWARGKDLLGYSLNGLRTSTLRFEDAGSVRSSEVVRWMMTEEETQKIVTACKERGIKLCLAISAAAMIAAHLSKHIEDGQHDTYSIVTLVDCRKYLEPVLHAHNIGFYHSAIINTHSVHGGEGLWEVAKRCQNSYSSAKNNKKHLKDIGELNFLMCRAIENPQLTPFSSLRTALISVFEEIVVYESCELHWEFGVEDYVGCASAHGVGPSIAVFDTIRDGKLDCACVYPSPLHSRKQIQEILEHMKKVLIEESIVDGGLEKTEMT